MKNETGFTLIEMTVAVAIFAVIALATQRALTGIAQRAVVERTVAGFSMIAEAAYAFRVDPDNDGWPVDEAELTEYLPTPVARNAGPDDDAMRNGEGRAYQAGTVDSLPGAQCPDLLYCVRGWLSNFNVAQATADAIGPAAREVAQNDSQNVNGEQVWPVVMILGIPGTDSVHEIFVRNDCDEVEDEDNPQCNPTLNNLTFNPNATLDLGGGTITNVGVAEVESITVSGQLRILP